jgi:antitoxin (DNA-binding transcriptional repressor) of toxin-antitoxin stability system
MKTLSVTEARRNLTALLKEAAAGKDIGILCGNQIVALRPVTVHSDDAVLREYDVTREELDRFAERMDKEVASDKKHGRLKRYSGNLENDL